MNFKIIFGIPIVFLILLTIIWLSSPFLKEGFFGAHLVSQVENLEETKIPTADFEKDFSELKERIDEISRRTDDLGQKLGLFNEKLKTLETKLSEGEKIKEGESKENEEEEKICQVVSGINPARDKIIFNEIAWMGNSISPNNEWIELKNISEKEISLAGWQILDKDLDIKIIFENNDSISAKGFYLLEWKDDETLPDVLADKIYTGNLKNTDEALYLFDQNCNLQDEVLANPDWPAGDNNSKRTMERPPANLWWGAWQTSLDPGGTPKRENSQGYITKGKAPTSSQPEILPRIEITEIMYDLEGNDEGREWLEIFNKGNTQVDFSQLRFYEDETNHRLDLIQGGEKLSSGEYAIVCNDPEKFKKDFPDYSKILLKSSFSLSNAGEKLAIKYKETILDQVEYNATWGGNGNGKSLQKIDDFWKEEVPSPGKENKIILPPATQTPETEIPKILINEVQIVGDKASYDFIELSNPSDNPIDISGYQLKKRNKEGTESSLGIFPAGSLIPARGYFLWACSADGYDQIINADISFKSYYLTEDNSIALFDRDKNLIDALAWGSGHTNPFVETLPFPQNPGKNQSLERIDFKDTDDNSQDFILQPNPTPTNSKSGR